MSTPILLHGGHLVTMDPSIPDGPGDLLVINGRLAAVGVDATRRAATVPDVELLDVRGHAILPGFVDTHRHLWQSALRHRGTAWDLDAYFGAMFFDLAPRVAPDDVYAGTLLGALAAIDTGTTTVVDWSHIQNTPDHTDAAIAALRASGARAVFAYGWPQDEPARWVMGGDAALPADIERVRNEVLADDGAIVTMALAARGPELTTLAATRADLELARRLGLRATMHVGTGELGPRTRAIAALDELDLLGPDLTFVHACTVSDEELRRAAGAGATASVSPLIEATMPGIGVPATRRLLDAGVVTGISADTEVGTAGDLFSQMRALIAADRLTHPGALDLDARRALELATIDGARAAGLANRTGSLTPGKRADLLALDLTTAATAPVADVAAAVVFGGHPGVVRHVMADGRWVKRDGRLVSPLAGVVELAAASAARLTTPVVAAASAGVGISRGRGG
jgi:cytosine/adenosine deaminase-related metal-dependent hydrolase